MVSLHQKKEKIRKGADWGEGSRVRSETRPRKPKGTGGPSHGKPESTKTGLKG